MSPLAGIGFASPWFLAALAALPALWYLLRISPPQPRRVPFPPIRILRELTQREETPARTPLWLLALRLLIAGLVIVALSGPMLNPDAVLHGRGPVVVVVDNGWAGALDWEARRRVVADLIDRADRAARPVVLVATAHESQAQAPISLLPAAEARRVLRALQPHPWGTDRAGAARRIAQASLPRGADVFWLADGLDDGGQTALGQELRRLGTVKVLRRPGARPPHGLTLPEGDEGALRIRVVRAGSGLPEALEVLAATGKGLVLGRAIARFGLNDDATTATFDLPAEARNEVRRMSIASEQSAGAVALLDESAGWRSVGLVSGDDAEAAQPLLSQEFYLRRALTPFADVVDGSLAELVARPLSMLVLADVGKLPEAEAGKLAAWVQEGGVLIRFAGPHLVQAQESGGADSLLPVKLREGDRALGGLLSWAKPAPLAGFEDASPFFGLNIPADVVVKRQILAEPGPDLSSKTWARLADGTPLVTGERRGRGWLVLFHTTARPDWSNLPVSGLFVDMLHRLVDLGTAEPGVKSLGNRVLVPRTTLDAFGRLGAPPAEALPIQSAHRDLVQIGPEHPPGLYAASETQAGGVALNLLPRGATLRPLGDLPTGLETGTLEPPHQIALARWLLLCAIVLGIVDGVVALGLRGFLNVRPSASPRRGRTTTAALLLLFAAALAPGPARAQDSSPINAAGTDAPALSAALETRLAYVVTGDQSVDSMSRAGLVGLSHVLAERTAFEPADPQGVDPETDELVFFPVLYWPMTVTQRPLSPAALAKVDRYMRNGGLILFDTRDQKSGFGESSATGSGTAVLRNLLSKLDIPPLQPVPENHVLTKSFYLLQTFPGRYAGGRVWVEAPPSQDSLFGTGTSDRDGVSSLIVGGNDWAAAWAVDESGTPIAATIPDDLRQRELAYRFGVNVVMYALTGNYKADQVHVPALLERLGQ